MKNSPATLAARNASRKHWRETVDLKSFPHEVERVCRDCKKPRMCKWTSSFTQTGSPEYKTRCNDCHNAYVNLLRKHRRPVVTSQALDRKYLVKEKCVNYLGGHCIRCGYSRCIKAMTFHHRDPSEKAFTVGQMLDRSWQVLRPELDKCDLLCFNCHMEEHCDQDQVARVVLGAPRKRGCIAHTEIGASCQ